MSFLFSPAQDPWHVPAETLSKWVANDKRLASETYGPGSCVGKQELPCLVFWRSAKERRTYISVLLSSKDRNSQCLVLDGPEGSELPNGSPGSDPSVGRVFSSVSSAATRLAGYSSSNGYKMRVENATNIELALLRPCQAGVGFAGLTARRLAWFYDLWMDILRLHRESREDSHQPSFSSSPPRGGSKAFEALYALAPDPSALTIPADCPFSELKEQIGYALVAHLVAQAKPSKDSNMRKRTQEFSRQGRRTPRPRATRLAAGTKTDDDARPVQYMDQYQVHHLNGGIITACCRTDGSHESTTWVPVERFAKFAPLGSLNRLIVHVLTALENEPERFCPPVDVVR